MEGRSMAHTRIRLFSGIAIALAVASAAAAGAPTRDGAHDFDAQVGRWHTELRRLKAPLSGSTDWVQYSGTSTVTPVWNGKASLAQLEVEGPAGAIEGLSQRLYDPKSRQWSLYYSNSRYGTLVGPPTVGSFSNGVGEFYSSDTLDGRAILVRFTIKPESPDKIRFEQSFSDDGGRTWEPNWIATDTRLR
jgi:hypothetical protein